MGSIDAIIHNLLKRRYKLKRILLFIACVSTILLTGCSETEETTMLGSVDSSALNTVGKMKKPEHIDAPAAPQMPGVGTPSVTGVSYYSDARLTKPLSGTIKQGKTIYTKVVFSEPMKHTASDEKNARPILSFLIDGKATRYRIKPHRTSGKNFQSGDCKPLGNGTDDYICKYTVQADDAGMFSLKVGKFSMDSNGNTLANTYTHETTLQLGQQAPPEVTEVSYYSDARLTKPLTGTIKPGKTIYTKVVFSEPMKHTASDEKNARPILSFLIDGKATRYRIKPHRTSGKNFQSGDCKPLGNGTDDYICKYTVQADDAGMFSLKVGKFSMDSNGNTLANTYTHETTLQLGQQTAPTVDYYKIVDAGLERAHKELVKFRVKYDTPLEFLEAEAEFLGADIFEKDYSHWVIEQEFNITWNWELDSKTAGIYRRAKGLNEDAAVYPEMTTREYIKLRLEFPEETDEEILERYKTLAEEGVI